MIEPITYRDAEKHAKQGLADWRLANVHAPEAFHAVQFPIRVDSLIDLLPILDTMQEDRFDDFVKELAGLTDEDVESLVSACVDYVSLYLQVFQRRKIIVPLSTMLAHLLIYKKLKGFDPNFKSVLEIGPGSGFLSFFLKNHTCLQDYSQIESTESFYILQSLVNSHVFGSRFADHALDGYFDNRHSPYKSRMPMFAKYAYEDQKTIDIQRNPICNHFPWWRIGDVADRRYDLVTSNANLNEFSAAARVQYLSLLGDVLSDQGALVTQCWGGGRLSYEAICTEVQAAGFAPVALLWRNELPGRNFLLLNATFVRKGHPAYAKYNRPYKELRVFAKEYEFVRRMYAASDFDGIRREKYSAGQILEMISSRLRSLGI